MLLKNRDWSFPVRDLVNRVYESFSQMKAEKFQCALGDVMREWNFLSIIWSRLQREYTDFYESEGVLIRLKEMKLSHKEISEYTRRFMLSTQLVHLDTECFLIHAKIMLDRVVFLMKEFFKGKIVAKGSKPKDSFTKFRNWFMNKEHSHLVLDEELANYLKSETEWFDELVNVRDHLIVHRKGYYSDVFTEGRVGKAKAKFDNIKNIVDWSDVKEIPDLNLIMDGISSFLLFFDEHFTQRL